MVRIARGLPLEGENVRAYLQGRKITAAHRRCNSFC
jgi:hypothetical protein